jgi:hypothetical protein
MADKKITALTALTAVDNSDLFAIVDDPAGTPTTKKVTADVLGEYMSTNTHVVNAINSSVSTLGTPIDETIVEAKGDLIVATADATPARLAVGSTNGHVLTVDSVETAGVKWAAIPAPTITWESDQNILANAIFS